MRILVALLPIALAGLCHSVQADVYMGTAADGSLVLTNIQRSGRDFVRIRRESRELPASVPTGSSAAQPYEQLIDEAARAHGLPAALLHAVIRVESGYDPNVRS